MGGSGRTKAYGHRRQPARAENFELSSDDGRPAGGDGPAALLEPRPQERTGGTRGSGMRSPRISRSLCRRWENCCRTLSSSFAAQLPVVAVPVIEVPKIFLDRTPQRMGDHLRQSQMVKQLVHVPTVVSYSSPPAAYCRADH